MEKRNRTPDENILILSHLRANAREQLTSLSKKTRIPVSTIFNRIKAQTKSIIKKHASIIDFHKVGFSTVATIIFKVDRTQKDEFATELEKCWFVNNLQRINNGYDYLCEAVFRNMKDLEEFNEELEEKYKIRQKQVYYHIEDIKREDFLASPHLLDVVMGY